MQRLLLRFAIIIIAVWIGGLAYISFFLESNMPNYLANDEKISVVATIYPLAFFAMDLDPNAEIVTIVSPGVEPHDYSPTINDVKAMEDAELFLINRGVDEWALDAITDRNGPTIDVLESLNLPFFDPHVWLDPVYAQEIVAEIGHELAQLDPENAQLIYDNTQKKIAELAAIDRAYATSLSSCSIREIVTAHEAFDFLARRYNFTAHSISGLNPEEEPSVSDIAGIVDIIRARGITTVFYESLTSDALALTVAKEADVAARELDPIENLSLRFNAITGYTDSMFSNLSKLSEAMVCQK